MRFKYSSKTGQMILEMDESDFYYANEIEQMLRGNIMCKKCGTHTENRGWESLTKFWLMWRELILELGKDGTKTRAKRELSDLKFAMLDGYDYATRLGERIVDKAKLIKETKQKEEEERKNAARYEDE